MKWMLILTFSIFIGGYSCKQPTISKVDKKIEVGEGFLNDISMEEAAEKISTGEAIFIDVRTPEEIGEGMIPGSIHIDFNSSDFESELNKLDKTKEYVVYCRSGGRSTKACKKMNELGFTKLNNMTAGYSQWSKR